MLIVYPNCSGHYVLESIFIAVFLSFIFRGHFLLGELQGHESERYKVLLEVILFFAAAAAA